MDRRSCLKALATAALTTTATAACSKEEATTEDTTAQGTNTAGPAPAGSAVLHPIVLHCDLKVDPAREQEMLDHFHNQFKPVGEKHKGFIDLKMLKLRTIIQGDKLTAGVNYRFQLTYENEELRQAWVASDDHAKYWPGIENCLLDKNFQVALWDDA